MIATTLVLLLAQSAACEGAWLPAVEAPPAPPILTFECRSSCFDRLACDGYTIVRDVFDSPESARQEVFRADYTEHRLFWRFCTCWHCMRCGTKYGSLDEDDEFAAAHPWEKCLREPMKSMRRPRAIVWTSSVTSDNPHLVVHELPTVNWTTKAYPTLTTYVTESFNSIAASRTLGIGQAAPLPTAAEAWHERVAAGKYSVAADIAVLEKVAAHDEARQKLRDKRRGFYRDLRATCDFEAVLRTTWWANGLMARLEAFPAEWVQEDDRPPTADGNAVRW